MDYTHVLYHAGCNDGFGAAWAVWRKLGNTPRYIPIQFGSPFPDMSRPETARVLMVDVAFRGERHTEFKRMVDKLVVVDHHKTNYDFLHGQPDVYIDLGKSAAVLAWDLFHPGEDVPWLLQYVQDYDLWKFELPDSREANAALSSYDLDFETWSQVERDGHLRLRQEGESILRVTNKVAKSLAKQAWWMTIDGHRVPVANARTFKNEVAEKMNELYPDAPFTAVFFDKEDIRCWSLRSKGKVDVAAVANKFGGGGHPNSAGFTHPIERQTL